MSRKWDEIQQGSFPEWINYQLEERNLHINSLEDLSDGVMLVKLLETISGKKFKRHVAKPRFLQQKIDNVNVSLQFLQQEMGLKVIGCNPQDIVSGNTKQIMGIIFLLIQFTKRREFEKIISGDSEDDVLTESDFLTESSCVDEVSTDVHDEQDDSDLEEESLADNQDSQFHSSADENVPAESEEPDHNPSNEEIRANIQSESVPENATNSSANSIEQDKEPAKDVDTPIEAETQEKQSKEIQEDKVNISDDSGHKLPEVDEEVKDKLENNVQIIAGEIEGSKDAKEEIKDNSPTEVVNEDIQSEEYSKENVDGSEENLQAIEECAEEFTKVGEDKEDTKEAMGRSEGKVQPTEVVNEEEEVHEQKEPTEPINEVPQKIDTETSVDPEQREIKTEETKPEVEHVHTKSNDGSLEIVDTDSEENQNTATEEPVTNEPVAIPDYPTPKNIEENATSGTVSFGAGTEKEITGESTPKKKKTGKSRRKGKSRRGARGRKLSTLNSEQQLQVETKREEERLADMAKQRVTIAGEILQTERSYVAGLTILLNSFLRPLRTMNLLTPASLRRIFSDIEVLYGFNCQFLNNLEARMKDWDAHDQRLGDIFLREVDYLKMYTMYVNNYNESVKEVSLCRKRFPKFVEFVDAARYSEECKGLDLTSYLIMPVQRIPRYVMLLADLLKKTPPSHVDYADLKASVEKTKEVADYVNEKKREAENLNQVVEVQEKLAGKIDLLEDASRRYVREGPMIDMSGNEKRNRYYFLFNDILVSASQGNKEFRDAWKRASEAPSMNSMQTVVGTDQTGPLKFKESFLIGGAQLKETASNLQDMDPKLKNMFQLIQAGGGNKPQTFVAPSYEAKTSWMGDIDESIMQHLDNRKIRTGNQNNFDPTMNIKGMVNLSDTLLLQNTETGVWKERYVTLQNGIIQWFKSPEDVESPKNTIEIYSCSVRLHRPSEKEFAFQIFVSQQIFYFACGDGEKLFEWINAIRGGIEKIMELKDKSLKEKESKYSNLPPTLSQMLIDPENQICADCSAPQTNWANVTKGVFLCGECYNLHKILSGSTLKSLTRGKWTDGQAAELSDKGNKLVNAQLETDALKQTKIDSRSPYESKVEFIKEKYNFTEYIATPSPSVAKRHSPYSSPSSKKSGRKAGWLVLLKDNESKRYFYILKKSSIYYYKSEKASGTPRGVIDVQTATTRISMVDETIFEIVTPSRIYTILCPSTEDRMSWIKQINQAKTEKPRTKNSVFRSFRFD